MRIRDSTVHARGEQAHGERTSVLARRGHTGEVRGEAERLAVVDEQVERPEARRRGRECVERLRQGGVRAHEAVSYTHLDVYKRQMQQPAAERRRVGIVHRKACLLYTSRCV